MHEMTKASTDSAASVTMPAAAGGVTDVMDKAGATVVAAKERAGGVARRRAKNPAGGKKRHAIKLFLMICPFLVPVVLFCYYPLFGWVYAFYDYEPPIPLSESPFVGLRWFKLLIENPTQVSTILQVLKNTFAMSGIGLLTSFFPVVFAIALNEIRAKWFRNLIQTLTTLPNFISWVLVYSIAFAMFSTDGMVNTFLQDLGLIDDPIKFLDSPNHVWLAMFLWGTWKGLGWGAILYLASISGIDQSLYEAAQVDGANRFQQIWHVTIPEVMPTYFVMLMLSVSNFLNNGMDQYFVFQNSFNLEHIQVLDLYVYNLGMGGGSMSLATAISMLKSFVSVVLLIFVNWVSKKTRGSSIV